jgi:FHA domain
MSLFKKTRLDRSVIAENKEPEVVKEIENSYPRIEEEAPKRASNTAIFAIANDAMTKSSSNKTVNPYTQAQPKPTKSVVKLTPISKENEYLAHTLAIEEASMVINRANIDPENPTISGRGHALIEVKNGQVFLSNQTTAETTFIQVKQPTQLRNGDVILLGDRLIRVEIENITAAATNAGLDD